AIKQIKGTTDVVGVYENRCLVGQIGQRNSATDIAAEPGPHELDLQPYLPQLVLDHAKPLEGVGEHRRRLGQRPLAAQAEESHLWLLSRTMSRRACPAHGASAVARSTG